MRDKKEQREPKQPIEMTSDELLDYTIAPEVAERLRAMTRDSETPEHCEPEDDNS